MAEKRVLLIEDEADILDLLAYNLRREGYSVTTATTGAKGLEAIRNEDFELLLCDNYLPDCMGSVMIRQLRDESRHHGIKTVLMTAGAELIGRDEGGVADALLSKPFPIRELHLLFRDLLRQMESAA